MDTIAGFEQLSRMIPKKQKNLFLSGRNKTRSIKAELVQMNEGVSLWGGELTLAEL